MIQILYATRFVKKPILGAAILMLVAAALLAAMHSVVRYLSSEIHPFEIVFFRNLFGFLALCPLLVRQGRKALKITRPKLHGIRGLTGIIAMFCWFYGLSLVPLTEATALSFTNVIFGSIIATIFLKEHLSINRLGTIFIGIIGVLVIVRPGWVEFNFGTVLIIIAAVCWGASVVIVKELSRTDSVASIVAWFGIQLSILSFPFACLMWSWPSIYDYFWLIMMGILGTLGHLALTKGLKKIDAVVAFPLEFTRLVWAGFFGYFLFSDTPDIWTWIGAGIILFSTMSFLYWESKLRPKIKF